MRGNNALKKVVAIIQASAEQGLREEIPEIFSDPNVEVVVYSDEEFELARRALTEDNDNANV